MESDCKLSYPHRRLNQAYYTTLPTIERAHLLAIRGRERIWKTMNEQEELKSTHQFISITVHQVKRETQKNADLD